MSSARHRLAALALLVVLAAPSCAFLPGGNTGYRLTAYFTRAVALYDQSRVKVMGVDAGIVDSVEVEGDRVRVEMTINDSVPLPADVHAAIQPLTLVGERNIVLFPPWRPGADRAADGDVIPIDRTEIPVEPDEALQAFTDLARAIDPDAVARLVTGGAAALSGRGEAINRSLDETAQLATTLAEQDSRILEAAANLHQLASTLNTREQQLGQVIDSFSQATQVLADERDGIARFLSALVTLTDEGRLLLGAYEGVLPGDIATLTALGSTLEANIGSVEQLVAAFPIQNEGILNAYDPERRGLRIAITLTGSAASVLEPLFQQLLGIPIPCIPLLGDLTCPGGLLG